MESLKKHEDSLKSLHKRREEICKELEIIKINEQKIYDAEVALRKSRASSSDQARFSGGQHYVPATTKVKLRSVVVKCNNTSQISSKTNQVEKDRAKKAHSSTATHVPAKVSGSKSLNLKSVVVKGNNTSQSSSKTNQVEKDRVKNKAQSSDGKLEKKLFVPATILVSEVRPSEPTPLVVNQTLDLNNEQLKTNQDEDERVKKQNKRIKAKQKKENQRQIRLQSLRDQIAILQKKKSDRINSQILQELTNEFPDSNLKMVPEANKIRVKSFFQDGNCTAKVDEKLKQQELEYYHSLPPPPPPPGKPGKHLPQPVEKIPQNDIRMYFHFNPILESYEVTNSPVPPDYLRK